VQYEGLDQKLVEGDYILSALDRHGDLHISTT
jgi:hypothetical protein